MKSGEAYNGNLVDCDTWMNVHLKNVICTSCNGNQFWKVDECFVRGNTIKYIRIPDEIADKVKKSAEKTKAFIKDFKKPRAAS